MKNNTSKLFRENISIINKYCYIFSQYYHLDFEDLQSESNEIFFNCYTKYYYNKISFNDFFKLQLKKYLNWFCLNEIKRLEKEKIALNKLYDEYYFYEMKLKPEINIDNDIKEIINKILNFCLLPDYKDLLKPYSKINKQKLSKKTSFINYFSRVYHYERKEIIFAIDKIRYILKEELI